MSQFYPWTFDAESFYTDKANGEYSLTWLTPEQYIRDPRFDLIGFSLKPGDGQTRWFTGTLEYLRSVAHSLDWSKILVIGHNMSEFDSLILTEVLGVRPAAYACTLQMARAIHGGKSADGKQFSASLEKVAAFYGLPPKGQEVKYAINKRRLDFTPWQINQYGEYCNLDTDLCWSLYKLMSPLMPSQAMRMASLCTKMFAQPRVALDGPLLSLMQQDMAIRKAGLMERVSLILNVDQNLPPETRMAQTQTLLRRDKTLADVLQNQYDIEPPMKWSAKQEKMVYAFAKTDEGMEELLDFEDELDPEGADDIQALAAARLSVKSTLAESRVGRFVGIASRGLLPVPLAYGKTHTDRLAGSQKINMQNMGGTRFINKKTPIGTLIRTPRGIERLYAYNEPTMQVKVPDGTVLNIICPQTKEMQVWVVGLRDTIIAPPGKKIVVVDSSQIELRVAHLLAGQLDTVDELRRGIDVYSSFASTIYNRQITKKDKKERQHGKVGMLQLQYQSGSKSFKNAARIMGGVRLTDDQSHATVTTYRARFTEVVKFWRTCQLAIPKMAQGGGKYLDQWGLCKVEHNRITMNGRMPLQYQNLREEMMSFDGRDPEMMWIYDDKEKRHYKKIYGGSVTENLCQWIAGSVVKDQTLALEREFGSYERDGEGVVLMVHDEAVLCVDENIADHCLKRSIEEFSVAPTWWPQLPVTAEGGIGNRYSEAK